LKQDFLFGVFAAMMKVSCYVLLWRNIPMILMHRRFM
jgi:hypothetical protein